MVDFAEAWRAGLADRGLDERSSRKQFLTAAQILGVHPELLLCLC